MKTEKEVRDTYNKIVEIMNDARYRASQCVSFSEVAALAWVLGENEKWLESMFNMYDRKVKT